MTIAPGNDTTLVPPDVKEGTAEPNVDLASPLLTEGTQPLRKKVIKNLPKARKHPYAGGSARSQALLDNIRKIIRTKNERRTGKAPPDLFAPLDTIKYGDAPHATEQAPALGELDTQAESSGLTAEVENTTTEGTLPTTREAPEAKRPRTTDTDDLWKNEEKPELTKPTKGSDLEPWDDHFYGLLQAADYPTGDPDDDLVLGEEDLPAQARRCPKSVRRLIRNAHRNLGHPSNYSLVRLMTVAKCHPDMISYASHMKFPTCQRRNPPQRIPKTTMPYRPTQFNQVIGIDLKWIKDVAGNTFYLFNILDLATSFNLGICLPDKSAKTLTTAFKQYWLSWAGAPTKIVADQGREGFKDFTHCSRHLGAAFKMQGLEAPWQNGMVERHGGVLGDIIEAIVNETSPVGFSQMCDVC